MTRRRLFDFRNKKKGGLELFGPIFRKPDRTTQNLTKNSKNDPNDPKFDQKVTKTTQKVVISDPKSTKTRRKPRIRSKNRSKKPPKFDQKSTKRLQGVQKNLRPNLTKNHQKTAKNDPNLTKKSTKKNHPVAKTTEL